MIQCVVFLGDVGDDLFDTAKQLSLGTSVIIERVIRRDTRFKIGYEIGVEDIQVLHIPIEEYPVSPKEHGVAFILDHRHLWLRSSRQNAILRIRATIIEAIHKFSKNEGFMRYDPPIFTPAACEGTTTFFETDYFNDKAYLTQSG